MTTAEGGAGTAQTVELNVAGMTCGACERHVQQALAGVPGVSGLSVSRTTASARVAVSGAPDAEALVGAVCAAGYDASVTGITSGSGSEPSGPAGAAPGGCCMGRA